MTDMELRIKVAELVGLTDIQTGMYEECEYCSPLQETLICTDRVGYRIPVPDYPNDLNAMHEVEMYHIVGIDKEPRDCKFRLALMSIMNSTGIDYIHATARQRAEAFVAVMEES